MPALPANVWEIKNDYEVAVARRKEINDAILTLRIEGEALDIRMRELFHRLIRTTLEPRHARPK